MKRARTIPCLVSLLIGAAAGGADLEPTGSVDLLEGTVQEIAFLPGNPSNPMGWAVVGRDLGAGPQQGITLVNLSDRSLCPIDLGENVQDVAVSDGIIYATLREQGSFQDGLASLDPGLDPCMATLLDRAQPIPNGSNVRFAFLAPSFDPHAIVANSLPAGDCGGPAFPQREDLAVYLYNLATSTLVSTWTSGEDGFTPACDRCHPVLGLVCGPNDTAVFFRGRLLMAVANLLDGVYLVDLDDPLDPVTLSHFTYQYDGRDVNGDPVPDRNSLTVDVELDPTGEYLLTTDQDFQGGHLQVWSVQDILDNCSDPADPCTGRDLTPVAEYFPEGTPPGMAHKMLPDWPYLWLTYFDYGLVLLDFSDPTAPREIARHDLLPAHPPGSFSQWGAYGAALALPCDPFGFPSDILVSDIGIWNSGGADAPGGGVSLRWAGPATVLEPLTVAKDFFSPGEYSFLWLSAPLTGRYRIYAGTLGTTPGPPDTHDIPDAAWCEAPCCGNTLPDPFSPAERLEYFLLRGIDDCDRLGSLGEGDMGPRLDPEPTICP